MKPYNPLDKKNLATSIAERLWEEDTIPVEELKPFVGGGIYVIYYTGDFEAYAPYKNDPVSKVFDKPIYMGKATSKGGRKGDGFEEEATGNRLYARLSKHRLSLRKAINLESSDFYVRYLIVDHIWIPLGEALIINKYKPIWNVAIYGFGNNAPGSGRQEQVKSMWDTIHPGRTEAAKLPPRHQTAEEILVSLPELIRRDEIVEEG